MVCSPVSRPFFAGPCKNVPRLLNIWFLFYRCRAESQRRHTVDTRTIAAEAASVKTHKLAIETIESPRHTDFLTKHGYDKKIAQLIIHA